MSNVLSVQLLLLALYFEKVTPPLPELCVSVLKKHVNTSKTGKEID